MGKQHGARGRCHTKSRCLSPGTFGFERAEQGLHSSPYTGADPARNGVRRGWEAGEALGPRIQALLISQLRETKRTNNAK